jgi:hypothetical protein
LHKHRVVRDKHVDSLSRWIDSLIWTSFVFSYKYL